MRILGIETSCDDTGIAIYDFRSGILINSVYNQDYIHNNYGGVVPELAARYHANNIACLIKDALKQSNCCLSSIHAIAYTAGPGLIGSLLVGATVGTALAFSLNIPTIPIHHMEGHLLSPMLNNPILNFPFLALLISGGNTQLVYAKKLGEYNLLGMSLDSSVGNTFDKVAKSLGLKYPGGPEISNLAKKGNINRFYFPRPMIKSPGLNFSFSGLRTFTEKTINNNDKDFQTKADIALAFEEAVSDTLTIKCHRALKMINVNNLIIAGGVSANDRIKKKLKNLMSKLNGNFYYPKLEFCTDNGAMIAYAGLLRFKSGEHYSNLNIHVFPKWLLSDLSFLKKK
ncbi:tRNA N6-adenosine threonylcarbamoyltransferase [Buchnera aphidicola (Eriosoma grossulariae)]|uniref:tRNA (adenosine(37)-N6)-threonylcarbamoyltransferase complex transferase subunit TsaD n=1 Tax=Buchnera aphidicola TaxID=9 RepID=UPI003463CB62